MLLITLNALITSQNLANVHNTLKHPGLVEGAQWRLSLTLITLMHLMCLTEFLVRWEFKILNSPIYTILR